MCLGRNKNGKVLFAVREEKGEDDRIIVSKQERADVFVAEDWQVVQGDERARLRSLVHRLLVLGRDVDINLDADTSFEGISVEIHRNTSKVYIYLRQRMGQWVAQFKCDSK